MRKNLFLTILDRHPYLSFFILLSGLSIAILASLSVMGCGADCSGCRTSSELVSRQQTAAKKDAVPFDGRAKINGHVTVKPGGEVERNIEIMGKPGEAYTLVYRRPEGVYNVHFSRPPDSQNGDAYIFHNMQAGDTMTIQLQAPDKEGALTDTATLVHPNGSSNTDMLRTRVEYGDGSGDVQPAAGAPALARLAPTEELAAVIWEAPAMYFPETITLTTQACQDALELAADGEFFYALRMPEPAHAVSESFPLPVVWAQDLLGNPIRPEFHINQIGVPTPLITSALTYAWDQSGFLLNELPGADGEYWMALALDPATPITCPAGLEIPAGQWSISTNIPLNLPGEVYRLPGYFCYEGQGPTPVQQAAANLLLAAAGEGERMATFGGGGVSCLGPSYTELSEVFDFHIWGAQALVVTPTQRVQYSHFVQIGSYTNTLIDLDYHNSAGFPMRWYEDSGRGEPDFTKPITPPVDLGDFAGFWLVGDVPASQAAGEYSVLVTATLMEDPGVQAFAGNGLYVGEWSPPAPAEPPPAPSLTWPQNGAVVASTPVTLTWEMGAGPFADGFAVQVDSSAEITSSNSALPLALGLGQHAWKVRAFNEGGSSPWSPTWTFTVGAGPVERRTYLPYLNLAP